MADTTAQTTRIHLGTSMDGDPIHSGNFVGWKGDMEESGKAVGTRDGMLLIDVYDSNTGETSQITRSAKRCWVE